jgi:hypothetical protein
MTPDEDFRLSRVQAEGWNAARKMPVDDLAQIDAAKIALLNPYAKSAERTRWSAGFNNALRSWQA